MPWKCCVSRRAGIDPNLEDSELKSEIVVIFGDLCAENNFTAFHYFKEIFSQVVYVLKKICCLNQQII